MFYLRKKIPNFLYNVFLYLANRLFLAVNKLSFRSTISIETLQ